jgi:3-oxoacyl-[acyl-carrier-protein] synthase-3
LPEAHRTTTTTNGLRRVRISGVGSHLPERILTNRELVSMVDTTDEWIVERSGIRERRIAAPHETSGSLGAEAARLALESADVDPRDVDLVVTATCTPDGVFPASASYIQHAIGATNAGAFDVNAACTGFLVALTTGAQFIAAGGADRVVVVGAETMSRIVDWTDRNTCVLFGDGAGAVVLEAAEADEPGAVEAALLRSDGSQASILYTPGPASARIGEMAAPHFLVMDGRAVFRQAVNTMSEAALDALARAGRTVDDVALCVPHQANIRILDAVARHIGLPADRMFANLDRYGNTSSASIPIALAEAAADGRLQPGDHVLLLAVGGGLSWGAMLIEWAGVRAATPHPAAATLVHSAGDQ